MSLQIRTLSVGKRVDGEPWRIPVIELRGSSPGPSTAFVAGVYGDKALSCLALTTLAKQLDVASLRGNVYLIPAANPAALEVGTRINPDHFYLNRRFPGAPTGTLTDQLAHRVFEELTGMADWVVDVHSGTPTMALWYSYDYGDVEVTSSFGHLPVIVDSAIEGQLSVAATRKGIKSFLPEFGGGALGDPAVGVEGCLNVLRYRGHLTGRASGPSKVPLIKGPRFYTPSVSGILSSQYATTDAGKSIQRGIIGWVTVPGTGERIEEFTYDDDDGMLLMVTTTPRLVAPGDFAFMVGPVAGSVDVPNA
jgi:predicted deacylase